MRPATQQNHFKNGHRKLAGYLLGYITQIPGQLPAVHAGGIMLAEKNRAPVGGDDRGDTFQQGGFAGSVGSDDTQDFPRFETHIYIFENPYIPVTEGEINDF